MTEPKSTTDLTETSTNHHHHQQQQKTETSPLKQNETKKNWFTSIFWSSAAENDQGSLKTISLNFLIFTVIVTLGLLAQIYYGGFQNEPHGSVTSDSYECSEIGTNILKQGGNAVDAAVASTFCLGVVNFHITGLGGGGYMLIYNHKKREVVDVVDFHAAVPLSIGGKTIDSSVEGLTVGVPGLLLGLWEVHQKFGKVSWKEVIMPASNLAKYGFKVSKNIISASSYLDLESKNNKNLIQLFGTLKEGKNITLPELAATLELIASTGANEFYNGSLAMDILYSVKEANGSMTLDDLSQYKIFHSELLHTRFGNFDILAPGSSSGGPLLLNALDTIQFLDLSSDENISSIILKLSDVLHDAYIAFLEKNDAVPIQSEQVASQVSAMDNEELYVSVVSSLNTWLGSQLLTGAGFILNNAIANGGVIYEKRPLSLSTPVIAVEAGEICGRRLILGSGDATIAAQVLTNILILNSNVSAGVESPRFFIDNIPRHIRVEDLHNPFFDATTINRLSSLLKIDRIPVPYKSVNIIEKVGDTVIPHSDTRGGGRPSQFK